MRKICLFAAVLLLAASALAQHSADEKAIRDLGTAWAKASVEHNVDGAVAPYADDASVFPDNAPMVTGREAIRGLWQGMLSDPKVKIDFTSTKIVVSKAGDMAYDTGTTEVTAPDAQGNPAVTKGKYVVVWQKRNGQWKAVADIFNGDKKPE
jgi:uncharacterized protein (TIGR02246 family)